jgi:asparagine synthase (glutamine-hydrolysing)
MRPMLLKRLYPYITDLSSGSGAYLTAFFRRGLEDIDARDYSHAIRWRNTSRTKRFFSEGLRQGLTDPIGWDAYPPGFDDWSPLNKAQFLEIQIFLSQYLLSSQGDRMGMAHSVEGRFPFLDHRMVAFCNQLPPSLKLHGLDEKYLLKQVARQWLPEEIWKRPKRPYRAPIHKSFFHPDSNSYVRELLSPAKIGASGLFDPESVAGLVRKIDSGRPLSETDDMALAGVISTQLVYTQFISDFQAHPPLSESDEVLVRIGRKKTPTPSQEA